MEFFFLKKKNKQYFSIIFNLLILFKKKKTMADVKNEKIELTEGKRVFLVQFLSILSGEWLITTI